MDQPLINSPSNRSQTNQLATNRLETVEEISQKAAPETTRPGLLLLTQRISGLSWNRLGLLAVLALAAFFNLFRLEELGYNNEYYASAVKSMLGNWSNFFFGAFDPAGFITVDKPPLFLWVQTAFAWLLGFSGLSLLLPQAIAGILSVALLYKLVKRAFGPTAGLLSALALALTPIFMVMSRHSNPETLLILVLLLQVYALTKALETERLRWILFAAVLAGVGFNLKMLEAFVPLPGFFLLYLFMGRGHPSKRLFHLTLATIVILTLSLSWAMLVDKIPPDQRPYIGGSTDNTVFNLILGYNGIGRVDPGGNNVTASSSDLLGLNGPFRLFYNILGGETNWLLPLIGLGLVCLLADFKLRSIKNPRNFATLTWAIWLGSFWLVFSLAKGTIHPYYGVLLAPPLAALFGAGIPVLWQKFSVKGWQSWLLPVGIFLNAAYQVYLLVRSPDWNMGLIPLVCLIGLVSVVVLVVGKLKNRPTLQRLGLSLSTGLFIPPLSWCINQLYVTPLNPTLPDARPGLENMKGDFGKRYIWENVIQPNWAGLLTTVLPLAALFGVGLIAVWKFAGRNKFTSARLKIFFSGIVLLAVVFGVGFAANVVFSAKAGATLIAQTRPVDRYDEKLASYLTAHQAGWPYLAAVPTTTDAAALILKTGQPVLAVGGFMEYDPTMSPAQALILVQQRKLRFFLVANDSLIGNYSEEVGTHAIYHWATLNCRLIDLGFWNSNSNELENKMQQQLYDCGNIFK